MSMVTRCPHCSTSFRITSELLKMHHGLVRCGNCTEVFNAFDSLSTVHPLPEKAAPEVVAAVPFVEPEPARPAPEPEPVMTEPEPVETEPQPVEAEPEVESAAAPSPEMEPAQAEEESAEEFFIGKKPSKFGWAWSVGSCLLVLSLLAQSAYLFRMEIGIAMPEAKPFLQAYCRLLECTIPLPRKADLIGIGYSSLHAETDRVGVIDVEASIRNSAPFAQAYPLLELTLTDALDAPVARKIFSPSDYLPKDARLEEGIPAGTDVNVALDLDTGSLLPNGYKLYLFYP